MKLKQNINILNALIRITVGLTVVAWSTAKLVKRPWRDSYLFITMLGAMKVAEGILRFCPLTLLYEQYMQNENRTDVSHTPETSMESMEGLNENQYYKAQS